MKSLPAILLPVVLLAAAACAQPTATGSPATPTAAPVVSVWKLVPATSDFGSQPMPGKLILTITERGEAFDVDQDSDDGQIHLALRKDGKEVVNKLPGGGEMKSRHWMEGAVMRGEISFGDGAITFSDRTTYSADGRLMTIERGAKTPDGTGRQVIVMERVDAPSRPAATLSPIAGSWKLDRQQSDYGSDPMPERSEARVVVNGHEIALDESNDRGDTHSVFFDDGRESTNTYGSATMKSKMHWEQGALVGEPALDLGGTTMTMTDRTTFSADGKTMTMQRVRTVNGQESKSRIVMVRQ